MSRLAPSLARLSLALLACGLMSLPVQTLAQAEADRLDFAGDLYVAGEAPEIPDSRRRALFAAGERVDAVGETTGAAHLAGRRVTLSGPVGGNLYAAGYEVQVRAPVGGDASLAGYAVTVSAPVEGVLRVGASEIEVTAPAGALLLAGERIVLDAEVAGDARLYAEEVEFRPGASVAGTITVLDRSELTGAPPADRVERVATGEWDGPGFVAVALGALFGLLSTLALVLAVQALFLGAAPAWSEALAFDLAERPFRALGVGLLTASALVGSIPVLGATVVGAPLIVLALIAAPLAALCGWALGGWGLGAGIWRLANRPAPGGFWARLLIGLIGLAALALLGLIPIAGWVIFMAVTLAGLGAAAGRLARRRRPAEA